MKVKLPADDFVNIVSLQLQVTAEEVELFAVCMAAFR